MKFAILPILFFVLVSQVSGAAVENCHMQRLTACGDPIAEFRKQMGTSFPTTNDQVAELCTKLEEAKKCAEEFQSKCMTPMQSQTMSFLTEGSLEVYKEFCKEGSELRNDYLKHATCIDESSKSPEAKEQYKYIEAALESLSEKPHADRLPTACCGYALMVQKSREFGEAKCGKEAVDSFQKVAEMAVSSIPEVVCSGFEPEDAQCQKVLPPPGTLPKGTLKNSHIAKTFASMYLSDIQEV